MKNILKIAAAAAFVAVPMQAAQAVSDDVIFNGTVTHTCTITVNNGGTMVADASFQNLSSAVSGGTAGDADVVATGNGFDLFIDVPSTFDSEPVEDTTGETFSGSFTATGATSASDTAAGGASTGGADLSNGTTNVDVDLAASKAGTDVFEAGSYQATVVLRCE